MKLLELMHICIIFCVKYLNANNYCQTKHICYSFVEVAAQHKQHVSAAMSASGKVSERQSFQVHGVSNYCI